jgi:hypothetical protein|tara:strand:+ start:66 stop:434 length:369 start_codon:yes stop_codon:yes gene_type:complete
MSLTNRNVKQLAQSSPSGTSAASIYSPNTDILTHITRIVVANASAGAVVGTIYHDEDGTTYNATTTIWEGSVAADTATMILEAKIDLGGIPMRNSSGNIAFKSATGDTLTITMYGEEVGKER